MTIFKATANFSLFPIHFSLFFVPLWPNEESQEQRVAALLYPRGTDDDAEREALAHCQLEYSQYSGADIRHSDVLH